MITFKQQFDKLTEAYIKDEIRPYKSCACFVGTILNGQTGWLARDEWQEEFVCYSEVTLQSAIRVINMATGGFYTMKEIHSLEYKFLTTIEYERNIGKTKEEALFIAFDKTLDLLKQIHESKGEVVEPFEFKKRELVTT